MSSTRPISPQALFKNPDLLLHKQPPEDHVYGPFDGLVGAVISEGNLFITSPNYGVIYEPQLGGDRHVYLRENLRYGPDDPLQWPQPFVPSLSHYVAIRRPVRNVQDPLHIMWCIPEQQEFVLDSTSLISGLGRLKSGFLVALDLLCQDLLVRKTPFMERSLLVPALSSTLSSHLHRLKHLLTDFQTLRTHVRAVQRLYLELLAVIDTLDIYLPRMYGQVLPPPGIAPVMGAFVTDPDKCEMLHKANIRVWFIRPFDDIDNAHIRSCVPVIPPTKIPCHAYHRSPHIIFTGSATDPNKALKIFEATRRIIRHPDPFSTVRAPVDHNLRVDAFSEPPTKRPRLASGSGRNKCEDPDIKYYPPSIASWSDALYVMNDLIPNPNPGNSSDKIDIQYAFPEPALLVAIENEHRRVHHFKTWLKWRSALLYRLSIPNNPSTALSAKVWKGLLSLNFELPGPAKAKKEASKTGRMTKTQRTVDAAEQFLQVCIDAVNSTSTMSSSLSISTSNTIPITWNGKPFNLLTEADHQEILWELCELNFRYELVALDARAFDTARPLTGSSTAKPKSHQDLINDCFPNLNTTPSLFLFDLSSANRGIASHDPEERHRYVIALKTLMNTWVGPHPASFDDHQMAWTSPTEITKLEKDVAQFYCRSFVKFFRRAPITPHRISHIVQPIQPRPGPITILNPRPNVFYDLTALTFDDFDI
ncbi:hypothetical protein BDN72DRAFT_903934 [Pluteus cervinus]|uniref:Uncharacterized protein n=1 Tax=Pluteus cervinus TaxID=181527 RepID=A0ACD3A6Y5_9AGAR|nr:hypothetical protein BDN72DRAFT_903934 [Pluteus cervinus]